MINNIFLSLLLILSLACNDASETVITKDKSPTEDSSNFELDERQRPILFDYTSTGCPGCGSWGKPTFTSIAAEYGENIVPIAVHIKYNDPMITSVSEALANNRTGSYFTPQLWVNNTNTTVLSGSSINGSASVAYIKSQLDSISKQKPDVALGLSVSEASGELNVRIKTKNLNNLEGEYYLAFYVLESSIYYNQSSSSYNPTEHNSVIREVNEFPFGRALSSTQKNIGFEYDETMTLPINSAWNPLKLGVAAVIWKKVEGNYTVVNAFYKKSEVR